MKQILVGSFIAFLMLATAVLAETTVTDQPYWCKIPGIGPWFCILNPPATTCSWCGYDCISIVNRTGKICPMIMPPSNWKCVLQNGQCVVQKPGVEGKICCHSFGYGDLMVKCCDKYTWTTSDDCKVPAGFVGGGKEIVDNSFCQASSCESNGGNCTVLGDFVQDTCEMHGMKTLPYDCPKLAVNTQCCGSTIACTPGTVKCNEKNLMTCNSDGRGWSVQQCPNGCDSSTNKCNSVVPVSTCQEGQIEIKIGSSSWCITNWWADWITNLLNKIRV